MITRERARQLRAMIVRAAASLADADALTAVELFAPWQADTLYRADERLRYGDRLYRVVQDHTSQADWTPDLTPALYTEVAEPGTIPVWRQPTGAQDAYRTGDRVRYPDEEGDVWICTLDYNVYAPGVSGWEKEA